MRPQVVNQPAAQQAAVQQRPVVVNAPQPQAAPVAAQPVVKSPAPAGGDVL